MSIYKNIKTSNFRYMVYCIVDVLPFISPDIPGFLFCEDIEPKLPYMNLSNIEIVSFVLF